MNWEHYEVCYDPFSKNSVKSSSKYFSFKSYVSSQYVGHKPSVNIRPQNGSERRQLYTDNNNNNKPLASNDVLRGSSQFVQSNAGVAPRLSDHRILLNPFQFISYQSATSHPTIRHYAV